MTEKEKSLMDERIEALEGRLGGKYERASDVRGQACFLAPDEHYIMITGLCFPEGTGGAIVIEHAHGIEEYTVGRFEDGDLFFMDDMTEDEMFEAMVREIEG